MKLGSLFSGGGLGDFGFMAAGMDITWQCEIDDYCQKILALRYPESKKYRDIKTLKGEELEPVNIITAGVPCQPSSIAGLQRGEEDPRWLWPQTIGIIEYVKPSWVVFENPTGIINLKGGMAFETICSEMESKNYEVFPFVFPACSLEAWHKRDRLWVICHAKHDGQSTSQESRSIKTRSGSCEAEQKQASKPTGPGEQYAHLANSQCLGQSGQREYGQSLHQEKNRDWKTSGLINGCEIWKRYWKSEPAVGRRINGYPNWLDFHIGKEMSYATQIRYNKKLRELWNPINSQALWKAIGGFNQIQKSEILFAIMCEYEKDANKTWILLESEKALKDFVRGLWLSEKITGSSYRPEHKEQRSQEHSDTLQTLSRLLAHNLQEDWTISSWEDGIPRVSNGVKDRVNRLKVLGNAQVPACTYVIGKMIMEIESPDTA